MNEPQIPEGDDMTDAMQEVLHRFTAAGWVQKSLVSDDDLHVIFTPLGLQRLAQLQQCFDEVGWMGTTGDWICLNGLCRMAREQKGSR
jgi:hypothetical protein